MKEEIKPIYKSLGELLRNVGIEVPDSMANLGASTVHNDGRTAGDSTVRFEESSQTVVPPLFNKADDMHSNSKISNHSRESSFLRMENLFDEVAMKIRNMRYADISEAEKQELPGDLEEYSAASLRNTGKPTVIGDSIPPPMQVPQAVQHVSKQQTVLIWFFNLALVFSLLVSGSCPGLPQLGEL